MPPMPTPSQIEKVRSEFSELIYAKHKEDVYQKYMENNPILIPREFIQNHGLHFCLVIRKLGFGKDFTTDFFYLAKCSGDWNCIFIEIEKPWSKYFVDGTNNLHRDFIKAVEQIKTWNAWLSNSSNNIGFINGTIKNIRVPRHMAANPCHMKYVLVFGRRNEYDNNEDRRDIINAYEDDNFKIISYDSLLESLDSKQDLYIGARHNTFIKILSNRYINDIMFAWMPPETLRISELLKEDIIRNKSSWSIHSDLEAFAIEESLPHIKTFRA